VSVQQVTSSRSRSRSRKGRGVAAISLTLLASACGAASAREHEPVATTGDASEITSPLATFFGINFDAEDQDDIYLAQEREINDWVQECMAQQGFEYRAIDPAVWHNTAMEADGPAWGTREWTETNGFGISTSMFDQETVGADLTGHDSSSYVEHEDPNEIYLASLSQHEVAAYYEALYGDDGYDWDPALTDEENDAAANKYFAEVVPTGCQNLAYEQFSPSDPYNELFTTFGDEINEMHERLLADPEITTVLDELSRCVSDKGFDYVSEEEFNEVLYQRLEPIHEAVVWPGSDLSEEQWAAMTQEQIDDLSTATPTMSAEGKAMLAEIQAYEIDVALAAYDCGSMDITEVYMRVSARYEQAFVDANRAELETLKNG